MAWESVVSGAVGGVFSAIVIGAATLLWNWFRRPKLEPSLMVLARGWTSIRLASVVLSARNTGRRPAYGVELEVVVPERLYPRASDGTRVARLEHDQEGSRLLVFVAHRDDPLHPAPPQAMVELELRYNQDEERPSGRFELPVAVRASNADEIKHACVLNLP